MTEAESTGDSPVGSSAGQHLVDADDVEGVQTHADVEAVFATGLHHILVGTDTSGLQSCQETHVSPGTPSLWQPQQDNIPHFGTFQI